MPIYPGRMVQNTELCDRDSLSLFVSFTAFDNLKPALCDQRSAKPINVIFAFLKESFGGPASVAEEASTFISQLLVLHPQAKLGACHMGLFKALLTHGFPPLLQGSKPPLMSPLSSGSSKSFSRLFQRLPQLAGDAEHGVSSAHLVRWELNL